MAKGQNFSMCHQLFDTICNVKDRQSFRHKDYTSIAYLVTQICKEWMYADDFDEYCQVRVLIAQEQVTTSYRASLPIDWTHDIAYADTRNVTAPDSENEDEEFFRQETPRIIGIL